mgnify:CR=1 FL=1
MKKFVKKLGALALAAGLVFGASFPTAQAAKEFEGQKVKVGVVGEADKELWQAVAEKAKKDEGIEIEITNFSDYNLPNAAVEDGSLDLNAFQHQIFLDSYLQEHKDQELVSIGNTVNAPLGVYSKKIKDIKDLKEGDTVAIPSDPTNGGRALRLLQTAGLIKVDEAKGYKPTVSDIKENKLNLKIQELDASQTARALDDVTASIINSGVAVDAGYTPSKDAIYLEPVDKSSKPYVNIIVARKKDAENATYKKIVEAYQTEDTKKVIEEVSKGSLLPAWETFGTK